MIERRLRAIGRAAKALGSGLERRYPAGLRERAIAMAKDARRAGWMWAAISEAIDIGADTIRRWQQEPMNDGPMLVPVEVLPAVPLGIGIGIVGTTPTGFRVEGLELGEIAILVKALS